MCSSLKQEMESSGLCVAVISEFPTETLSTKSLFAPASGPTSEHFMSVRLRTAMPELSLLDAPASTLNKAGYHSA